MTRRRMTVRRRCKSRAVITTKWSRCCNARTPPASLPTMLVHYLYSSLCLNECMLRRRSSPRPFQLSPLEVARRRVLFRSMQIARQRHHDDIVEMLQRAGATR